MRCAVAFVAVLLLAGCESAGPLLEEVLQGGAENRPLDSATVARGLREALSVGSGEVVKTLGQPGAFADSVFHIPLPQQLQDARDVASKVGLAGPFDRLELKMNEAAEAAVPQAREVFANAITRMTFDDVMAIYRGADDAATQYLKRTTAPDIEARMRPVIDAKLQEVGATQLLAEALRRYNALPFVQPLEADLSTHVSSYAQTAMFSRLADEERAIRTQPVKRTTALLRRLFAG